MIWVLGSIVWYTVGVLGCYIGNRFTVYGKLKRKEVVVISIAGPFMLFVGICFAIFDRAWWNEDAFQNNSNKR